MEILLLNWIVETYTLWRWEKIEKMRDMSLLTSKVILYISIEHFILVFKLKKKRII